MGFFLPFGFFRNHPKLPLTYLNPMEKKIGKVAHNCVTILISVLFSRIKAATVKLTSPRCHRAYGPHYKEFGFCSSKNLTISTLGEGTETPRDKGPGTRSSRTQLVWNARKGTCQ